MRTRSHDPVSSTSCEPFSPPSLSPLSGLGHDNTRAYWGWREAVLKALTSTVKAISAKLVANTVAWVVDCGSKELGKREGELLQWWPPVEVGSVTRVSSPRVTGLPGYRVTGSCSSFTCSAPFAQTDRQLLRTRMDKVEKPLLVACLLVRISQLLRLFSPPLHACSVTFSLVLACAPTRTRGHLFTGNSPVQMKTDFGAV
ncbi:unnamed protein product [Protopolystoma xenopodis]|uniref:Uncharacterized protein n=1 Tax=Protopolystoma xenopodis TaxID=117903 RepID=A0A3S5FG34_9PLAT|nr:unnamed protein product [Protopolystoma xenopodis]